MLADAYSALVFFIYKIGTTTPFYRAVQGENSNSFAMPGARPDPPRLVYRLPLRICEEGAHARC